MSRKQLDINIRMSIIYFENFDVLLDLFPLVVFVDVDGGVHDAKSGRE